MTMARKTYQDLGDPMVDVAFEARDQFDWVVQEDPQLQDELNRIIDSGEKIDTVVVNKVLDRIRDL
jgi:hypothetical protein